MQMCGISPITVFLAVCVTTLVYSGMVRNFYQGIINIIIIIIIIIRRQKWQKFYGRTTNCTLMCFFVVALFVTYFVHSVSATVSYGKKKSFWISGQWSLTSDWTKIFSTTRRTHRTFYKHPIYLYICIFVNSWCSKSKEVSRFIGINCRPNYLPIRVQLYKLGYLHCVLPPANPSFTLLPTLFIIDA